MILAETCSSVFHFNMFNLLVTNLFHFCRLHERRAIHFLKCVDFLPPYAAPGIDMCIVAERSGYGLKFVCKAKFNCAVSLTLLEVVRLPHVDADQGHQLQLRQTLPC